MSIERSQKVIEAYFAADHGDTSMLADDIVFTDMASGSESHGPEEVLGMLNWFYHVAFEATPETSQMIFSDGHAVWEGFVSGKHDVFPIPLIEIQLAGNRWEQNPNY